MKRIIILALAALTVFALALNLVPRAAAQDIVQKEEPKQNLMIIYPSDGIVLSGEDDNAIRYKGLLYVKVYPVTATIRMKHGDGPIFSDEIKPCVGFTSGEVDNPSLPLGEYEVHFSMRIGKSLRTCIKKDILLTTNGGTHVTAEMSSDAQTLIIGGDLSIRQMEDILLNLDRRLNSLQEEVSSLKNAKLADPAK